jgi:predicted ester cyclase
MPEKNEAVVRRLMEDVWSKGNLKLIDEIFTPDCVNNDPMNTTRGPYGARETVTKYRSAFPDCRLDIDEIFSAGDRVVVRFHYSGTHKTS